MAHSAHTSGSAGNKSLSTLASAFKFKNLVTPWSDSESRFVLNRDFAKLHEDSWGKSMTIEEQGWRDSQEAMDLAVDVMVADDDRSNPESETGPGCYPLDPSVLFRGERRWIRKDYIRMYDFCDQWYEQVTGMGSRANRPAPSVVITGQSGVG